MDPERARQSHEARRHALVIALLLLLCGTAAAQAKEAPTWTAGPNKAYTCTHYLVEGGGLGAPMKLLMRATKDMKFTLAAKTKTNGKVTYEIENPPPGAKLAGAKFLWKVAGKPGDKIDFSLVAIGPDGGRAKWPIHVEIADERTITAWSAGLGSVWPDCSVNHASEFTVEDLDGDGKDDVIFAALHGEEGAREMHVKLQRGNLKFIEVHTCFSCSPSPDIAVDGSRLLVMQDDCCCIRSLSVMRFEGDMLVDVGAWQVGSDCAADDVGRFDFDRDAKDRITGMTITMEKGKPRRFKWRDKRFQ